MKPRYFEDFATGDRVVTQGITLTEANIVDFGLRYDPQPLHIDKIAAEQGFYGGLIASGWQIAALAFRMFWQSGFIYGGSLGSPGVQDLRWLKPADNAGRPSGVVGQPAGVMVQNACCSMLSSSTKLR